MSVLDGPHCETCGVSGAWPNPNLSGLCEGCGDLVCEPCAGVHSRQASCRIVSRPALPVAEHRRDQKVDEACLRMVAGEGSVTDFTLNRARLHGHSARFFIERGLVDKAVQYARVSAGYAILAVPDLAPKPAGEKPRRYGPAGLVSLTFALVLTFLAQPAAAGDRTEAYAIHCGLKAADLATTEAFLANGVPEGNPLMRDRGVRIAAGIGTCVVASEVDRKLAKHTKARWVFRALGAGLLAFAVQHNARAAQRGGAR